MKNKNQKEMWEIKNTVTKMKNAFDELISTLDMIEERVSHLKIWQGASLVAQWQRICLPIQETQV